VLKGNGYVPARDAKYSHDHLTLRGAPAPPRHSTPLVTPPLALSSPGAVCRLLASEDRAMAKVRLVSARPYGRAILPLVDTVVAAARPGDPLLCLRPAVITAAARRFVDNFPGDALYAVKSNPEPRVLRALWTGGVRHFDCASLGEVGLVRKLLPAAG